MKTATFFILILLLMSLTACGDSSINQVKDGTIAMDRTAKVGDVLDNYPYFKSTSWMAFEDQSKRKIVQFEGIYDVNKALGVNHGINLGMNARLKAAIDFCIKEKDSILYSDGMKLIIQFRIIDGESFEIGYIGRKFFDNDFGLNIRHLETIYRNDPPDHFFASVLCMNWVEDIKKYEFDNMLNQYIPSIELRKTFKDDKTAENILNALEEQVKSIEQLDKSQNITQEKYDTIINMILPSGDLAKTLASFNQIEKYRQLVSRLRNVQQNIPNPSVMIVIENMEERASWYEDIIATNAITYEVFQARLDDTYRSSGKYYLDPSIRIPQQQRQRYETARKRLWTAVEKIYNPKAEEIFDEIENELNYYEQNTNLTPAEKQASRKRINDLTDYRRLNSESFSGFNDQQRERFNDLSDRGRSLMYR